MNSNLNIPVREPSRDAPRSASTVTSSTLPDATVSAPPADTLTEMYTTSSLYLLKTPYCQFNQGVGGSDTF